MIGRHFVTGIAPVFAAVILVGMLIMGTSLLGHAQPSSLQATQHASPNSDVSASATAAISLTKTVGVDAAVCATTKAISVTSGTAVTYCYTILNTGLVTFTLHDLVDSELGSLLTNFPYSLSPGASAFLTETATITQTTVNSATWSAYNPGPTDVVSATDSATVTVLPQSIVLAKTVGVDANVCATAKAISVTSGTAVTYCYEIVNTGLTTFTLHNLVDSEVGSLLNGFPYSLSPGASAFLTATATITQTTVNSATWSAYNPGPTNVVSSTDSATVTVVLPSIVLTKTVGVDANVCASESQISVGPGVPVTYCYEVTNTGGITLTRHDLVDSQLGDVQSNLPYTLAPQASFLLTQTAMITETTVNTATWSAYNPGPTDVVSATRIATVTVVPPAIAFTKTVGLDTSVCASGKEITVESGTAVTYCFALTNTGLTTLTRHDLVDSELGTLRSNFPYSLTPQSTFVLTQTAVITETTVNTATWTAYNPGPINVVGRSDSARVEIQIKEPISYTLTLPLLEKQ